MQTNSTDSKSPRKAVVKSRSKKAVTKSDEGSETLHLKSKLPADAAPTRAKSTATLVTADEVPIEGTYVVDMIAEAAYYIAESRSFEPGHELEDWLRAESQIRKR